MLGDFFYFESEEELRECSRALRRFYECKKNLKLELAGLQLENLRQDTHLANCSFRPNLNSVSNLIGSQSLREIRA